MKRTGLLLLIACCLIVAGCATPEPEAPAQEAAVADAPTDVAQKAAEIAKAIEADPDATEQILEGRGLTVDEFEQMMYEISADPELSKAYEAALAE
jgi:hypothetical protein